MSRINRRKWSVEELGLKSSGGLMDLFDNQIKSAYRINDAEYDKMASEMNDDEMKLFVTEKPTFAEKRAMINLLNKFVL